MRPMEEALSAVLREKGFRFMRRRGEVSLDDIYTAVKRRYPMLCDDNFPCIHNGVRYSGFEWQHTVRNALKSLSHKGIIQSAGEQSIWIFRG